MINKKNSPKTESAAKETKKTVKPKKKAEKPQKATKNTKTNTKKPTTEKKGGIMNISCMFNILFTKNKAFWHIIK